jgi:malonyl-CoA/methylmalonyl-CoA synthetase
MRYFVPSGFAYVVCLWAVWAAGGVAVPLCTSHPLPEQVYSLQDSKSTLLLVHPVFQDRQAELVNETSIPALVVTDGDLETQQDSLQVIMRMVLGGGKTKRSRILHLLGLSVAYTV